MKKSISQWLLGLVLVIYPLVCLLAVFILAQNPLRSSTDESDYNDELTSNTLLPDFSAINQAPERKQLFLETLRPLVEQKNLLLQSTRDRLLEIKSEYAGNQQLNASDTEQLNRMREDYKVDRQQFPDDGKAIDILLLRVDVIPASMVLAQAAIESGWGTSRFAEEANNLFGQWCYTPGCGIVPARRAASAKHEVRKFDSVEDALNSYYRNINTHNAYRALRDLRAKIRHDESTFTGSALIAGLSKYCGRGPIYISELRALIRSNNLE
ncbi:MAG TPA: glucosaminidase domain-containing protein [Cellvibrio sp.]|nr:glucosaminidase domain-containing protein [Cellvibrio sp.]